MQCREVSGYLPAYADADNSLRTVDVDHHLSSCSGCRAELEQYRDIGKSMRTLMDEPLETPGWLLDTLTETVVEKAERMQALRERTKQVAQPALVGGALLAAGVAGAILVGSRRRRRRGVGRRLREAIAQT
ncbi:MAG: hypothetical protein LC723_09195 [Actinobacteria bacterium]|nr:hypothetical protein [Actinomycetota bacterium]